MNTENRLTQSAVEVKRFLDVFLCGCGDDPPGRVVVEMRVLGLPRRNSDYRDKKTGFFELSADRKPLYEALKVLLALSPADQPNGIFITMNPVNPDLLARANNHLKRIEYQKELSATDVDVISRRWLLIDVDPVRLANISSTDAEKFEAEQLVRAVRDALSAESWPQPMLCDSGNGYHLWYPIADVPVKDDDAIKLCLKALAHKFDTAAATIDTSVFNPSRIVKIPGTWARKGDSTLERPHRMAKVLEVPS